MTRIGIIGAGITGLTTAFKLQLDGYNVTVWDSGEKAGGAVQSYRVGEWLAEAGPNSIQDSDKTIAELIEHLGLSDRLMEASTAAKRRYIVRDSKPVLVPNSPLSAITTPLFSTKAKLGVLGEPFRKPLSPGAADESLADFVRRRLGQEFLDYTINPMVGGIYAGDPEKLSVAHAFPKVKALEDEFGSLIKGAVGRMRQRRKSGEVPHKKRVLSFPNGLGELTEALSTKLGDKLNLKSPVSRIKRNPSGSFEVNSTEVDHLIYAGQSHFLESIKFDGFNGLPDASLSEITYAPVHSVTLGFNRKDISHPLDGFGVLVPEVEPLKILGCLFTSSIFPQRAPDGGVTLTVFIGGMRRPELTQLDDNALLQVIHEDLNTLLGVRGEAQFTSINRWYKAIPQYEVGYGKVLNTLTSIETANPGFEFAGNYKTGISLDACIRFGWNYSLKKPLHD